MPHDKLVVLMTKGIDSELSSVALTLATGAQTAGLDVALFLTSAAVDIVRRKGADLTHVPPLEPLAAMIATFRDRGGAIWACPPCVSARGYEAGDLIEGVEIRGASAMFARVKEGAVLLSL